MEALVRKHPRYGYRRIWALLRREGFRVNRKRIYRLWKQRRLPGAADPAQDAPPGHSENSCHRLRPEHPNHIWAWDFIFDRDERGRSRSSGSR